MAALLIAVAALLVGAAAVLALAVWASPLGAALLALLIVGAVVWFGTLSTSDRSLTDAIRRAGDDRPELLGPGGPDDPDRP